MDGTGWPGELRDYQTRALAELDRSWADGGRRAWVVLPPGTGKTLVGLEAARRLGRRTVVLVPNTAIQNQWVAHWSRCGGTAGTDRGLGRPVTVLTYQSLAVFDPDAETDEEGRGRSRRGGLVRLLHDNGRALVDALHDAGPVTLVLDECHHLLDVWGRLLAEILGELPDARVIGLTATPPESLTPDEATLVDALFGVPILGASIPAMVRQGYLAPFAELAWLTAPSALEADYIDGEAERFAELTAGLLDPGFTSTGLLSWLDARMVERATRGDGTVSWARLESSEPRIADAALRFHHNGLLALPPGARPREKHRREPTAEDWVALLNDYVLHCLMPGGDERALEAIKRALPAVGYQLTRRGIRQGRSPVDRVLARGAAKTRGAVEIAAAEGASLGARLRCLVLCDHERAGARLPVRLREVMDADAGSAWLALRELAADPRTRALGPMLVTGRTVAADEDTARAFLLAHPDRDLALEPAGDGLALVTGAWSSRTWVGLITAFFEDGGCRVLVGTRGLLGEGWDAKGVNTLIDLTTATTPTSVVQTRGRALRLDPSWPGKAANTWTVVCVSDRHPKGAADWDRFVRKHSGYLAAAPDSEIVAGVAHVDAAFSPYAPPPTATFDRYNLAMLERAADRAGTRDVWRLGTPFRDELVHTLRVRPERGTAIGLPALEGAAHAVPEPPGLLPAPDLAWPPPLIPPPYTPVRSSPGQYTLAAAVLTVVFVLGTLTAAWEAALVMALVGALVTAGLEISGAVRERRRRVRAVRARDRLIGEAAARLDALADDPPVTRFAYAVADGLRDCGLARRGSASVTVRPEPDGTYRLALADVDTATSELFAGALDEVLGPLAAPRYVVSRHVVRPRPAGAQRERAVRWSEGKAGADGVVYHAVPSVFGTKRARLDAFVASWNRWVSRGGVERTSTPEGEGILAANRGADPLAATTVMRMSWD